MSGPRRTYAMAPSVSIGSDARVRVRQHPNQVDSVIVTIHAPNDALVGDLYLSREAAAELAHKVLDVLAVTS